MIVTLSENTITYKMGGQTLLLDVPGHVNTIRQFKNNLLGVHKNYSYNNLLVCYIKRGIDYVPYDDSLIDFNQTYYVIRRPIECDAHKDPNNAPLILNFDSDSDESDSDDDMPELENDDDYSSEVEDQNGNINYEDEDDDDDDESSDDEDDSSDDEDDSIDDEDNNNMSIDNYDSDYNEPIEME